MSSEIFYISDGSLYRAADGGGIRIPCGAVDQFLKNIKEINERRDWKTSGEGAQFMGTYVPKEYEAKAHARVEAVTAVHSEKLIYAVALETALAVYAKNPTVPDEPEGYVTKKMGTRVYHMDYCPKNKQIIASASESDSYIEKHLALFGEEKANFRIMTEGESVDITPSFSRSNPNIIHFSSAGFYIDKNSGGAKYSSYALCRYDIVSNDITEIQTDEKYDFILPRQTADGKLYCIRRKKEAAEGVNPLDILLAPIRFLRAIFGWLNFFTERYAGESLVKKTGGKNPAKNRDKSEHDIFIEGNLINVNKALEENKLAGEQCPGIAPSTWELVTVSADGSIETVKKGVLDYTFDENDNIIYSNGKYIMRRVGGREEVVCEAKVARSLCVACLC